MRSSWFGWRNRLLSSTAFQRWASAFPLTRPIARRRARAVFDLCAGFVYSQTLLACVRLGLFEDLRAGPRPLVQLAARCSMAPVALRRLVEAAISLELLQWCGEGEVGLGPLGAAVLGSAGLNEMIEHHALFYADLRDPVGLLRGELPPGELARYWPYAADGTPAQLGADQVAAYSTLMSKTQPFVSQQILDGFDFRRCRHLLDVGGGEGAFLLAAGARAPRLQLTLFDLPAVAERARLRFAQAGLGARARAVGGDFLRDALPGGADVVSLVRVLHDQDDARALTLLRAVRAALPAGGQALIAEPMAAAPGAGTVGSAYFGFYLLAMGRGRARTDAEITALLHSAGFAAVRSVSTPLPLQTGLLVARA